MVQEVLYCVLEVSCYLSFFLATCMLGKNKIAFLTIIGVSVFILVHKSYLKIFLIME